MTEAEAYDFTISYLRKGVLSPDPRDFQADLNVCALDIQTLVGSYISDHDHNATERWEQRVNEFSPAFLSAVWELCLLGVLRPGYPSLAYAGTSNTHFSITESGKRWLREAGDTAFIPLDYEAFSALLQPFAEFSPVFFERARDAALCWKAQAYFACCAMVGAAAEAILLSAAVAKVGNDAIRIYQAKSGRSKVESIVIGQAKAFLQKVLHPLFGLIAYWRDQAAHGASSGIDRNEALTALRSLFYSAKIVHENWSELTAPAAG